MQVIHNIYLVIGPWCVGKMTSEGPPGFFFTWGVIVKPSQDQPWQYIPTPDTLFASTIQMCTATIPLTLWTASVIWLR